MSVNSDAADWCGIKLHKHAYFRSEIQAYSAKTCFSNTHLPGHFVGLRILLTCFVMEKPHWQEHGEMPGKKASPCNCVESWDRTLTCL